ncbi:hypothetical protein [Arthrobacter sp. CJ23]|uniref:hypothetical protein n=1 Tax=Arthrobacter sp. CJ23 TaxID=2972479 RepID=UPI00215C04F6|nr:hypothetical protein [Arthrobacter sp. CJ23]UVJ39418.1 hypothetical protein NVV90_19845 [Arthrobacter sp. CJ23]
MSEQTAPGARNTGDAGQAIDRLLADAGLDEAYGIRTELLELRALAGSAPAPSAAVRALMVPSATVPSAVLPTAVPIVVIPAPEPAPVDELAARRRRKRHAAITGIAVVVSLAGGVTAAAASEGGLHGAFEHFGAVVGTVVAQLTPGAGNPPQNGGPDSPPQLPAPTPGAGGYGPATVPGQTNPAPAAPNSADGAAHGKPQPTPGGGAVLRVPKGPWNLQPGNVTIPAPPITPPGIAPSDIAPSGLPVPVPTVPANPSNPAK